MKFIWALLAIQLALVFLALLSLAIHLYRWKDED